jgi:hypothetical protein
MIVGIRRWNVALLLAAGAGIAAPAAAQRDTVTSATIAVPAAAGVPLRGRVLDARTGEPLRAASVKIPAAGVSAYTDQQGNFSAARVPPGTYGAFVGLLGYRSRTVIWSIGEGDSARVVRLEPDPVALQGIQVQVRRIERRSRATGRSMHAWDRDALVNTSYPTMEQFVMASANLTRAPCGSMSAPTPASVGGRATPGAGSGAASECVYSRGAPTRPCVIVDEAPSMLSWLALYRPQEIYRLEVYGSGGTIIVYTTYFAQQMAHRRVALPPLEALTAQLCGTG